MALLRTHLSTPADQTLLQAYQIDDILVQVSSSRVAAWLVPPLENWSLCPRDPESKATTIAATILQTDPHPPLATFESQPGDEHLRLRSHSRVLSSSPSHSPSPSICVDLFLSPERNLEPFDEDEERWVNTIFGHHVKIFQGPEASGLRIEAEIMPERYRAISNSCTHAVIARSMRRVQVSANEALESLVWSGNDLVAFRMFSELRIALWPPQTQGSQGSEMIAVNFGEGYIRHHLEVCFATGRVVMARNNLEKNLNFVGEYTL